MTRFVFVWLLLVGAKAHGDQNGSITGTLGPGTPRHAVVWLEGAPAGAWKVPRETVTLSQRGARFHPDFVVIVAGQTVNMPNDDRITHNVFSVSPAKKFDLGHYPQGESRSVTFDKPGVVDLYCNIHENMHGVIVVVPSTFFALPDGSGRFRISGVPPGRYRVVAYSADGGASAPVTVAAAGTTNVTLSLKR